MRFITLLLTATLLLAACGADPEPTPAPPAPDGQQRAPNGGTGRERAEPAADNVVSGRTFDSDGRPMAGIDVALYVVPRRLGAVYQAKSGSGGRYSLRVPQGVYLLAAQYNPDPSDLGEDLYTAGGESTISVEVPPGGKYDFRLP